MQTNDHSSGNSAHSIATSEARYLLRGVAGLLLACFSLLGAGVLLLKM